jgi:hypothetical protein
MVVGGSPPVRVGRRQAIYNGGLAQLGEHLPYKQRVGGSIPSSSTMFFYESKINFIKFAPAKYLSLNSFSIQYAGVAQLVEQLTCNQ